MKKYSRDQRSPKPSSALASKVMSSIKAKNTKPELIVRNLLRKKGLKNYRLHPKIIGRPDIAFMKRKVAIFIHGCYWHSCPKCSLPIPKSNTQFWLNKFIQNIERDNRKEEELRAGGWEVLILWECQIKHSPENIINQIYKHLGC